MTRDQTLYRRLLKRVFPYRNILLCSMLCMAVAALADATLPALMKPLLDGAFINKDERFIFWVPIFFFALFLVRGVANYLSRVGLHWVANQTVMDLRLAMFDRLLDAPVRFHDQRASGGLVSCFSYDVTQIKEASTVVLVTLVRDLLTIVGLLAWMLYLDWVLTVIGLVSAPFIAIIIRIVRDRLRAMSRGVQDTMGELHRLLYEVLGAHRIVKLHAGKAGESSRFAETTNAHRRFSMKFAMAAAASGPAAQIIAALVLAVIIYVAARMASAGELSVGDFVSFFTAMFMLLSPVRRLVGVQEHVQRAMAACENVFALIDVEHEDLQSGRVLDKVRGAISFDEVCFSHAARPAPPDLARAPGTAPAVEKTASPAAVMQLKDITLDIAAGETVALVGHSGSGKTTLVNLLPRFYEPDRGAIRLDGVPLSEINLLSLRRHIAYVGQSPVLFCDTVRNNVAYGGEGERADDEIWKVLEMAGARGFVESLPQGLETVVGEAGALLSGGQRQRLAIARALLRDAQILILDEATSALDTHSERQIREAMETIRQGRTCIIVAHRLSTVESADRIVVLEAGEIVELGTHQELMRRGKHYRELHQVQLTSQSEAPAGRAD